MSEVVELTNVPYLSYIFGQAGLSKECRPRLDTAPGQGLHCFLLIHQLKTHSKIVK